MVNTSSRGLTDWLVQRCSAIYMFFYVVVLAIFFIKHPGLDYFTWKSVFDSSLVKIFSILFFLSLILHAWVGIWTIFTDYIKLGLLRLILNVLVIFSLTGFFFAALLILWSV